MGHMGNAQNILALIYLFAVYLTTLSVLQTEQQCMLGRLANNHFGKKWSWPNMRYYHRICWDGLVKTMKTSARIVGENHEHLCQDSWFPG
jgi:hypothetical protein